jgi:hypothetical protein
MTVASSGRMQSLWLILRAPLAIFVASCVGLAAALFGEGAWHWLSWLLLAVPLIAIGIAIFPVSDRRRFS